MFLVYAAIPKNFQKDRLCALAVSATRKRWQVAPEHLFQTHSTLSKSVMVPMGVSKLGRMGLIFIDDDDGGDDDGEDQWHILLWGASDSKATACPAWDLWRVLYLPARQCCRSLSARDNQALRTRHLHSFHQTLRHPTSQIWPRLTPKYGEKCSSGSTKFMTLMNGNSA